MFPSDKKRGQSSELERRSGELCKKDAEQHSQSTIHTQQLHPSTNSLHSPLQKPPCTVPKEQHQLNRTSNTAISQNPSVTITPSMKHTTPHVSASINSPLIAPTNTVTTAVFPCSSNNNVNQNGFPVSTNSSIVPDNSSNVPSSYPNDEVSAAEVSAWISTLTEASVERAIYAGEQVGYDQNEIQQIAEHMAFDETAIPIVHVPNDNRPYIQLRANNVQAHPLLDCGAMVCVISYVDESELEKYQTPTYPCSMSITTVTKAQHRVTGVMWLNYEVTDTRRACIPTVVMQSHRSYFIVGINFFNALNILFGWGDICSCSPMVQPWNPNMHRSVEETKLIPSTIRAIQSNERDDTPSEPQTESEKSGIQANEVGSGAQTRDSTATNLIEYVHTDALEICDMAISPDVSMGMVGLSNRISTCQLNRLKLGLRKNAPPIESLKGSFERQVIKSDKFDKARECVNNIRNSQHHRHVYTRYEAELNECDWTNDVVDELVQAPANASIAEFALSLLVGMPKPSIQVSEIVTQPTISTAEGPDDTWADVQPPKHCCVTEPHVLTEAQQAELDKVMAEFPYTNETGVLNYTPVYTQRINTGDAPPEMRRQYQMSPYVLVEVEKEIEKLIERGIVEPIDYSAWRWPILWVKKKTGGGRICVDARGLNKITVRDAYPTLKADVILQNLPNAKFISCLDMTSAFHQIEIHPDDRDKTAFAVGHRFYRYKRALMGFTNSPADLAKVLDKVFGDMMPHVYHYVDDFIILSATFEEHVKLLKEVARRLREANLTISRDKSVFCHKKVTFLGYALSEQGLTANPERVQPILDYKRPETVKEMRRLLGMIGYYRRFLPNIAKTLAPLTELTRGESKTRIKWNEQAEKAFGQVKEALMSPSILAPADYRLPYKIYTDASLTAGAAVLTQIQNGQEKVIAFHSAKFSPTQQNYSATERECLAVLTGVEKFRPYIDGVQFTVVTDHASLKWLQSLKEPHGKLARWAMRLQAFDIVFEHRPGSQMTVPDALSRSVEAIDLSQSGNELTTDKWYRKMKELAEEKAVTRYKISNGLLYHCGRFDIRLGERRWSICVPKEKVKDILAEQHDSASHAGYWKTLRNIQRLYYWPCMYEEVSNYVKQCSVCRQTKHTNESTRVPMGEYRDPISVGRVISLDLVGPLPPAKTTRHQWLIVAVDVFSKYVFARTCTKATTNVITEFLEKEIFYKFETPEVMITDNGAQFTSDLFKSFLKEHGVQHILTPNYHPQSNPVESSNKNIKQMLRAELISKMNHIDWASYVQKVVMRINTTPRHPTGFSPHFLAYGREKVLKGTEHRAINDENPNCVERDSDKSELIYQQAAEEARHRFEQNKARYNLRATVRKFAAGDIVYIKNQKQSSAANNYTQKLAPIRREVYVKCSVPGTNDMYELMDQQKKFVGVYHASEIHAR